MDTILVTAIGTAAGTAIVRELKKYVKNTKVIGTDINQQYNIVTSRDVDEFYTVPPIVENPQFYYSFIKNFCVEHNVNYIYCVIDEEVNLLRSNENDLESIGVKLCLADKKTVETCHFKNIFCNWIEMNFPDLYIEQYNENTIQKAEYPLFVKPIEGRASIGCKKIENEKKLQDFFYDNQWNNYIVQKYITGTVITVDIVRDQDSGITNTVQKIEYLRNSNGCGIAVEIIEDQKLKAISIDIAKRLELNGVINAEFFLVDANNENMGNDKNYKIIEINPRFSAGTEYSCMAGVNTVVSALMIAKGQCIPIETPQIGNRYAKRYDTYRMR